MLGTGVTMFVLAKAVDTVLGVKNVIVVMSDLTHSTMLEFGGSNGCEGGGARKGRPCSGGGQLGEGSGVRGGQGAECGEGRECGEVGDCGSELVGTG